MIVAQLTEQSVPEVVLVAPTARLAYVTVDTARPVAMSTEKPHAYRQGVGAGRTETGFASEGMRSRLVHWRAPYTEFV